MCSSSNKNRWPVARVEAEGTDTCKMSFFPDLFICLLFFVVSCSHCCWLSCDDSFDVRGKSATRPSFFALAGVLIMHAPTIEVASSRSSLALGGAGQSCCLAGSSCPEPKKKKSQSVRPLCLGGGGARERGLDTSHFITSILAAVSRGRLVHTIKGRLHCLELGLVVAPHLS